MKLMLANGRKCPQCQRPLYLFPNSERTVRGGTWYEVYCQQCGYRANAFKPRRTKRKD